MRRCRFGRQGLIASIESWEASEVLQGVEWRWRRARGARPELWDPLFEEETVEQTGRLEGTRSREKTLFGGRNSDLAQCRWVATWDEEREAMMHSATWDSRDHLETRDLSFQTTFPTGVGRGRLLALQCLLDIPQRPSTLEMFVFGFLFQRVGREQMPLPNLEAFVRMCKSTCEREFKEETKGRGVGTSKRPHPVGERNGAVGRHRFPHSRHLKLGTPPALPFGQGSGNVLEQHVRD